MQTLPSVVLHTCLSMCATLPGTVNDSMFAVFKRCWIVAIACTQAGRSCIHSVWWCGRWPDACCKRSG